STDGTQYIQDLQKVIHEQAQEGTRQYYSSASPKTMHYSSQTTKSLTVAERERELVLNKYKQEHKKEKNEIFLKIKESFKSLDIPEHKKLVIGDCQTLRDLCSAVSCQETHNLLDLKNTTVAGSKLLDCLNCHTSYYLRLEICPDGAPVRMRDIRSYATCGVRSTSGYFLNASDHKNIKYLSQPKNENIGKSSLMFQHHSDNPEDNASNSSSCASNYH
ncbi:hypothetical protein ACR9PT_13515, partial [Piscirickettsia salmonis]